MNILNRVAIVGASTLKGKELKDVIEEHKFPALDVRLLDSDEFVGQLESVAEEVTFFQSVTPEQLREIDLAFFATDESFTRNTWQQAHAAGCGIVDMSYTLDREPGVAVRSPWAERLLGGDSQLDLEHNIVVPAHPLAVVCALILLRLAENHSVRNAALTAFEPASEHGKRGMDELHQQTINLLSFHTLPTAVFDAQVAFNLLHRYGAASASSLEDVEARVLRHFSTITNRRVPVPSLMLLQAPVFHGYTFSMYIELESTATAAQVAESLEGEHMRVSAVDEDAPSNVNVAGQEVVMVSVRRDNQRENGVWIWGAADNLKIAALTAVECATALAAARPQGKIQ